MVWKCEVDSSKGSVWIDENRFIILSPHQDNRRWIVRMGIRSDTKQNQEALYKNRSRAMIQVKNLLKSRSWSQKD
jgi:hypothetical protein